MKKLTTIALLCFILTACASTKQTQKESKQTIIPPIKQEKNIKPEETTNKDTQEEELKLEGELITNYKTKGSCDVTDKGYVCIDYTGDDWRKDEIEKNCEELKGIISENACKKESVGGCKNGPGTSLERITWYYAKDNKNNIFEGFKAAHFSCKGNPDSEWVNIE